MKDPQVVIGGKTYRLTLMPAKAGEETVNRWACFFGAYTLLLTECNGFIAQWNGLSSKRQPTAKAALKDFVKRYNESGG